MEGGSDHQHVTCADAESHNHRLGFRVLSYFIARSPIYYLFFPNSYNIVPLDLNP